MTASAKASVPLRGVAADHVRRVGPIEGLGHGGDDLLGDVVEGRCEPTLGESRRFGI
jgi:hypothetical protein